MDKVLYHGFLCYDDGIYHNEVIAVQIQLSVK